MVNVKEEYRFKFNNNTTNDSEELIITDFSNKTIAYDTARDKLINKLNCTKTEFEKKWNLEYQKKFISFADKPWDSFEELKSDLSSISGVRFVNIIPMHSEYYGPPKLTVDIENTADKNNVGELIKDYYDGLIIDEKKNGFTITINPHEFN